MNLKDTGIVLRDILSNTALTPHLWGGSGLGKTALLTAIARDLSTEQKTEWALISIRLGQFEPGDLIGRPIDRVIELKDGSTRAIMEWELPGYFPMGKYRPCGMCMRRMECSHYNSPGSKEICDKGIIFLDEINRAQENDTLQAIFQFIEPIRVFDMEGSIHYEHRLHTHVLPEGFKVCAAANPPTDEYLVCMYDDALMPRFAPHIKVQGDVMSWLSWANTSPDGKKKNIQTDEIREFINVQQDLLYKETKDFDLGVKYNPRAYEFLDIIEKNCNIPERLRSEVHSGIVGDTTAVEFFNFCKTHYKQPVTGEQIIKFYQDDKSEYRKKVLTDIKSNLIDRVHSTLSSVLTYCDTNIINDKQYNNLRVYLFDLPRDFQFNLVKQLQRISNNELISRMSEDTKIYAIIEQIVTDAENNT